MLVRRVGIRVGGAAAAMILMIGCGAEPEIEAPAESVGEAPAESTSTTLPLESITFTETGARVVTQEELLAWMEEGTAPIILDVRRDDEFNAGHIEGAIHIPYDELPARAGEIVAEPGDPILVYCRSGRRAGVAATALAEAGYGNLMDLEGHINGWTEAGLPLVAVDAD